MTYETPAVDQVLTTEQLYNDIGQAYEVAFAGNQAQLVSIDWVLNEISKRSAFSDRPINSPQEDTQGNIPTCKEQQFDEAAQVAVSQARILDIGCGTGRPVCAEFAKARHLVHGVDISKHMIALARVNVPQANATFQHVDLRVFLAESDSNTFDAITVYFSFADGQTQEQIRTQFRAVYRLLKPEGLLVFATVPSNADVEVKQWMGRKAIVSSLPPESAVQSIKDAGFVIEYEALSNFTPNGFVAGLVDKGEDIQETHLFVYARKSHSSDGESRKEINGPGPSELLDDIESKV